MEEHGVYLIDLNRTYIQIDMTSPFERFERLKIGLFHLNKIVIQSSILDIYELML